MSGYVDSGVAHRARDAGVLDVLAKPLVARDIARSLADALQHRRASVSNEIGRAGAKRSRNAPALKCSLNRVNRGCT